ncbi:sensor histidine kinase [Clostridium fermenticellae]|uniref:histidine kinase n=1 Tax=Clostridium fermenticellae TaxID=2068654 RepID=A0A386H530_9CLOT|nr:HAMP domain-containing sensor histidine kinase [Clostridium fermenticellae]AYD40857.1 sensor histidine kinase [Clostridium fermenticellae]
MVLKGSKSLKGVFTRYILCFGFVTILTVVVYAFLFETMIQSKVILPANYLEQKLEENRSMIVNADKVNQNIIPDGCGYGVYSKKGKILYGNFTVEQSKEAWNVIKNNQDNVLYDNYYKVFYRKNDICIVRYSLKPRFRTSFLQNCFPNIELIAVILLIVLLIGEILLLSAVFAKYISKEMKILMEISNKVRDKNLEFTSKHSNIREIEEVINSLNDMKCELKNSLEKQWNMEEFKKNQISALAHDIKTPLTVIKGNAELSRESISKVDSIRYDDYILKNVDEIQKYLKLLIGMTKSESMFIFKPNEIKSEVFFRKIIDKEEALAAEKKLRLINKVENVPGLFYADEELLYRSIMNVISNAIDYSPNCGRLIFKICRHGKSLEFVIKDSGIGFSDEDIESATEQFYRGDKSRNSKDHYGMGLSITNSFIKLHGGVIELSNSKETGGAKVVLRIPLNLDSCKVAK